jgi:hypothetical protein
VFDIWNGDEVKFRGVRVRRELARNRGQSDRFGRSELHLQHAQHVSARLRIQAISSSRCLVSLPIGILAVQTSLLADTTAGLSFDLLGTTLVNPGKFSGRIFWNTSDPVPEGGIRYRAGDALTERA